jgi:hypothetical protein
LCYLSHAPERMPRKSERMPRREKSAFFLQRSPLNEVKMLCTSNCRKD